MSDTGQRKNPYVGPRAFERGDRLYGRDLEVRRLLNLLIAERIVLLYSPSGAGKTSLIQAALIPELEGEGFRVWPTMRVNRELPLGEMSDRPLNRYVLSLLLSLDEALPQDAQTPIDELAVMTLDDYLGQRTEGEAEAFDDLFIFDQFEEFLTLDPTDRDVKLEFFEQLGAMLRNRRRWALFAMREEFIAGLDPYLRPVPTRFSATFRLELLSPDAARQAMQRPAATAGVHFTDGAAGQLTDDLRAVRVLQPDGTTGKRLGLYVEPVQLQVVCRHLWARLPPDTTQVVEADLEAVGDVDRALADYYSDQVRTIAAGSGVSERTIREWIDRQLITEQGVRGQVLQGHEQSRGLDNQVIWQLVNAHLVRAEDRRGATWFELSHDRMIEPVRVDNAAWRGAHLGPVQRLALQWEDEDQPDHLLLRGSDLLAAERWAAERELDLTDVERRFLAACRANLSSLERQAVEWESQGRPGHMLLREQALVEAQEWAAAHPAEPTSIERAFLQSSQEARELDERERRRTRLIRWLAIGASVLAIIAFGLFGLASFQTQAAQRAAADEAIAKKVALTSLADAEDGLSSASEWLALAQARAGTIQALEATNQALAAQLAPTPSVTPTSTGTPPGVTSGPIPSPTHTAMPIPLSTPTPDQIATAAAEAATAQAIDEKLVQVRATQTSVALQEDCLSFNPAAIEVKNINGRWKIVEGSHWIKDFEDKEDEARAAFDIFISYGFNRHCFVGRPDPSMVYYLVGSQAPTGPLAGEDCVSFDPAAIEVQYINGRWKIVEGSYSMMDFEDKEDEARAAFDIIINYGFNRYCFVGRPDPSMTYFRR